MRSLIQACASLLVLTASSDAARIPHTESSAVTPRYASWHQKVKLTLDGLLK